MNDSCRVVLCCIAGVALTVVQMGAKMKVKAKKMMLNKAETEICKLRMKQAELLTKRIELNKKLLQQSEMMQDKLRAKEAVLEKELAKKEQAIFLTNSETVARNMITRYAPLWFTPP